MKRYGLIGKSLSHSFSKSYFTEKFEKEGTDAVYENFELSKIEDFPDLCERNPDIAGLNVTIPYKSVVIPFLDSVDSEAAAVGAVNTIAFQGGKTIGYNTDIIGFRNSIKPFLAHGMEKALILGTGGASKAVAHVLKSIGIDVFYATRNPKRADHFAYTDLNERAMEYFRLIVNTTPLGTFPNVDEKPVLPYGHIGSDHLLYDLVYNPPLTAFMKEGQQRGATVVNGLSMLKIQADAALDIWRSKE